MTWSAIIDGTGDVVRLNLRGDVRGTAASPLLAMLVQIVETGMPDELVVDLHAVAALDVAAVTALTAGYRTAVEHGTSYRLVGAHGQVCRVLHRTGTYDVLSNSDDIGALMLTVLQRPPAPQSGEPRR